MPRVSAEQTSNSLRSNSPKIEFSTGVILRAEYLQGGIMDFSRVIEQVCGRLDDAAIRYALIGGFAMALRGVQRATVDLDFIMLLEDLDRADAILRSQGYKRVFHSENVSHYRSEKSDFGRIDILHAFRAPAIGMLGRADRLDVGAGLTLPVAATEDIIGLKIQAAVNDPRRSEQDWLDIRLMVEAAAIQGSSMDWQLIGDYLEIFDLGDRQQTMKEWYGQTQ